MVAYVGSTLPGDTETFASANAGAAPSSAAGTSAGASSRHDQTAGHGTSPFSADRHDQQVAGVLR